jgi:hypothetical protein
MALSRAGAGSGKLGSGSEEGGFTLLILPFSLTMPFGWSRRLVEYAAAEQRAWGICPDGNTQEMVVHRIE